MSKPREFWVSLENNEYANNCYNAFGVNPEKPSRHTHVIELTPELSRKLELFDEAVRLLKEKDHYNLTINPSEDENLAHARAIETFLKKLGE